MCIRLLTGEIIQPWTWVEGSSGWVWLKVLIVAGCDPGLSGQLQVLALSLFNIRESYGRYQSTYHCVYLRLFINLDDIPQQVTESK